jgi:putative phosphoesterase
MRLMYRIGVISDTHGRLNPQVGKLFAGVDHIVHAGDVGSQDVLDKLALIAPLTAVSGNVDWSAGPPLADLPRAAQLDVAGIRIVIGHIRQYITQTWNLSEYGVRLAISGHTHRAQIEWRDEILFLNPGAAGAGRFGLPRSVALLEIEDDELRPRIVPLE